MPESVPGWMVVLGGFSAAMVPVAGLVFARVDIYSKNRKSSEVRRRSFERDAVRVYDEYMDARQTLVLVMDIIDSEPGQAKLLLRQILAHSPLPDPSRHIQEHLEDEKTK